VIIKLIKNSNGNKYRHICIYTCIYIFIHTHIWIKRIDSQTCEITSLSRYTYILKYTHTLRHAELKLSSKGCIYKKKAFPRGWYFNYYPQQALSARMEKNLFLTCGAARLQVSCVLFNELMNEKIKKTAFNYLHVPCSGCSSSIRRRTVQHSTKAFTCVQRMQSILYLYYLGSA